MAEAQPAQKALSPVDALCYGIDKQDAMFQALLPSTVSLDKFKRTLKTAVRINQGLVQCSRESLYSEASKCAQDGLIPDGREAIIVPFKDEAKYIPMPAGLCKRARNSGEIAAIDALTVFEKDEYQAWVDEKGQHFKHLKFRGGDRGKPVLTYAYGITKDGSIYFEEMEAAVILKIKDQAIAKAKGKATPWTGPFEDEMWRKSALHRLCKYRLPSSSDMVEMLERDADLYPDKEDKPEERPEPSTRPRRTGEIIEAQAEKEHAAAGDPDPNIPI